MEHEVEYCIYNKNHACICEITRLNSLGMCEECILINLDKDFLETEKKCQLGKIEERRRKETD